MKVVILCGGMGTRLREETEFKPKPMVQIGGMPILWHIMKTYSHYGMRDFVLCLGYKGEYIKQFFLDREFSDRDFTINLRNGNKIMHEGKETEDWGVTLAETGLNSMTGSRLKQIEKYVGGEEFMLTYGDGLANINVSSLLAHHRKRGKIGTITGVNMPSRFGMIKYDKDWAVTKFVEKPILDDCVSGGYFVFKKDIFDYVSAEESCVLETEVLTALSQKKQLSLYRHEGFWQCMDTYRDYLELNKTWDSGKIPWKVW